MGCEVSSISGSTFLGRFLFHYNAMSSTIYNFSSTSPIFRRIVLRGAVDIGETLMLRRLSTDIGEKVIYIHTVHNPIYV